MKENLVEIRDLHVRYGDREVLHGLNADLRRGRMTALIGLNGSGKTTLLRTILKETPYQGTITFHCGHDHSRPVPNHVGYVPQKLTIDATLPLTVADLLALALQRRPIFLGISRRARAAIDEILERVELPRSILASMVSRLSGGELQRVLLGLALQPHPELLLLDEPAAGVDIQFQEKLYQLLARLNHETGVTILLVSHELNVVTSHAQNVLCLKDGRIACQGPPRSVLTTETLQNIFGAEQSLYAHHHHEAH